VRPIGNGAVLTWDYGGHGTYELLQDGQVLARGRLVTLQTLTDAAFDYAKTAFDIALGLVAVMVLFLGLMRVGQDAGLVQLVARVLHPVIRLLFPGVPREHPASAALLMNITTTVLGLANAATPFGLKAMEELQKLNPRKKIASNAQVMLLGINTAGFALLPTTLLALRKSAGCAQPFEIIGTCMVAGAAATLTAIIAVRVLGWLPTFSVEAAAAEEAREAEAVSVAKGAK
jgi:spore maturation protein A